MLHVITCEELEAGEYCVVVAVDTAGDSKIVYDCVFNYYGSQDFTFDRVRYKDDSGVFSSKKYSFWRFLIIFFLGGFKNID